MGFEEGITQANINRREHYALAAKGSSGMSHTAGTEDNSSSTGSGALKHLKGGSARDCEDGDATSKTPYTAKAAEGGRWLMFGRYKVIRDIFGTIHEPTKIEVGRIDRKEVCNAAHTALQRRRARFQYMKAYPYRGAARRRWSRRSHCSSTSHSPQHTIPPVIPHHSIPFFPCAHDATKRTHCRTRSVLREGPRGPRLAPKNHLLPVTRARSRHLFLDA